MARNDADKAARRKQRQIEKKQQGTAWSVSCAGYSYYEKLFIRMIDEKIKYGKMEKDDPKRASSRGIIRGLAIAIRMWQEFYGTPEDMTIKEIEARTPWDEIPQGNAPKRPRPLIDGKNPFDL